MDSDDPREKSQVMEPEEPEVNNLKMYCVCSKEVLKKMNGVRGKIINQGGHSLAGVEGS